MNDVDDCCNPVEVTTWGDAAANLKQFRCGCPGGLMHANWTEPWCSCKPTKVMIIDQDVHDTICSLIAHHGATSVIEMVKALDKFEKGQ